MSLGTGDFHLVIDGHAQDIKPRPRKGRETKNVFNLIG